MEKNQLTELVRSLLSLARETEWIEFKHNNADPEEIGEYLSALANSAALKRQKAGYIIWGVDDSTHKLIGTDFKPHSAKVGGQELESWLANLLHPRPDVRIYELEIDNVQLVIFEIPAAHHTPIRFKEMEFVRVGSYKKKLKEYPEKERELWAIFQNRNFEEDVALENLSGDQVLGLLDYQTYFELTSQPIPSTQVSILNRLVDEKFLTSQPDGKLSITHFGAILFARDLRRFGRLSHKALRVIAYSGKGRIETIREMPEMMGYAVGFERALAFIKDRLPLNEQLGEAFRKEVTMYPARAIRELVANTLIHQDFYIFGAGPKVEIFSDRIEFTNPGSPLIDPLRFIDQPPRSRNEQLAAFMRRINICEERGSGIDKVIFDIEIFQLPAPDFRVIEDNTVSILYADKPLSAMDAKDRVRACYQHACLKNVFNERMTNESLRTRLKIAEHNYSTASRIIAETMRAGLIKPFDPEIKSKRLSSYVPFWF
ncbi:MAG: putative DNA binding domain-containing protein [Acidobacteria bacterium]|nr:putative DNA binding domain-containing protein [Acidobacteriota bacterium]